MNYSPDSPRILKLALAFSALAGLVALILYSHLGMILFYNDATSHLDISRRIVDNLKPGIVQIGSNWLPLVHLLELPFIWNYQLWQTGLAGSIVSLASFMAAAYFIYKITFELTHDSRIGFLAVVILAANANYLYLQVTPMFEPVLLACMTGSVYYLLVWSRSRTLKHLVLAALFAMLASITRYDAWPFVLAEIAVVAAIAWRHGGRRQLEGRTLVFAGLAGFGIALWLLYNQVIFGSATYFAHNEFAAATQQLKFEHQGKLPTKGDMSLSFLTFLYACIYNVGWILAPVALIGMGVLVWHSLRRQRWQGLFVVLLLALVPLVFYTYALFKGQLIIVVPQLSPHGLHTGGTINADVPFFNIRYGLMLVPIAAIAIAFLVWKVKWWYLRAPIVALVLLQSVSFYSQPLFTKPALNFADAKDYIASRSHLTDYADMTSWMKAHYDGGLILTSSAGLEKEIFGTGIDLRNYITEGTAEYWRESLVTPSKHARWILISTDPKDRVGRYMKGNRNFQKHFKLVFSEGHYEIYRLK